MLWTIMTGISIGFGVCWYEGYFDWIETEEKIFEEKYFVFKTDKGNITEISTRFWKSEDLVEGSEM